MKAMVGVVLAILIIFGLRLFWPMSESDRTNDNQTAVLNVEKNAAPETSDEISTETDQSLPELTGQSDKERTRLMRAEYEILEDSRNKLKRHIAKLKHEMWGLKFPPETAKEISKKVLGASKLLKNPHMLGAFSNAEGIKDETAKIKFAQNSLEEIDLIVKAKIEETTTNSDQTSSAIQ